MDALEARAGYTPNGLPYNRLGKGTDVLVVFDGLGFENTPMHGAEARFQLPRYSFLADDYTVFVVKRRRGLREGCGISDMSDDYAQMIRGEFGRAVDIVGLSSGGVIAQVFAVDHPDLVRKLVLWSTCTRMSPDTRDQMLRLRELGVNGDWKGVTAFMLGLMFPDSWYKAALISVMVPVVTALGVPDDPSDFAIGIDAELAFHGFSDRLGEITAPTLVVSGEADTGIRPDLVRETAKNIPGSRLILYPGQGHPASGRQFEHDVLAFLKE